MSTKIGGFDSSPIQTGTGGAVKRGGGAAGNAYSSKTTSSSDTQITESARQLAALEQAMKDLPAIDEAKVEQLRSSIEGGSYQVDAEKVANKLLQFESLLGEDA